MEETMMDKKTQKIGVICSIVQIILSIICLIYSAINQENIIIWVLFLCSGILSLSSNTSRNNKKEDEWGSANSSLPSQIVLYPSATRKGGAFSYPNSRKDGDPYHTKRIQTGIWATLTITMWRWAPAAAICSISASLPNGWKPAAPWWNRQEQ